MTHQTKVNQYQVYADLLGIEANQIDDVWLELDNALFIGLADDSCICINHSCSYETEYRTTTYSGLEIKQPIISDVDYNEHYCPISKKTALALLEAYFESTWGTKSEYMAAESYREQALSDVSWEETCRDTAQWLATA